MRRTTSVLLFDVDAQTIQVGFMKTKQLLVHMLCCLSLSQEADIDLHCNSNGELCTLQAPQKRLRFESFMQLRSFARGGSIEQSIEIWLN